ncbi:MAG: SAM-dependent methyltransferase [Flammeovirgaceae bacterium]|nr:SAM-dependent methyltransferase [Flammeovirgaceae bacterium]MBE62928.1 SAM-dependent methyltransferase [Flammeovirgaceae bacterium]HCX21053.1 SAM-dependent methyltransferase [Cytophagales bacterium]
MKDIHGRAIRDFYQNKPESTLLLHTSYGETEEMPVEVFFREEEDLSVLENLALIECSGRILDIGAGAGAHALMLQARDLEVYALENSPGCVEVMRQSGVTHVIEQDYQQHNQTYDTILLLMNGLGIAGRLSNVSNLLKTLSKMLNESGQILVDSSDIGYLYEEDDLEPDPEYYGNIQYQYEYKGNKGDWFDWVYVDQETLQGEVAKAGLELEILYTDENDQYLARITKK